MRHTPQRRQSSAAEVQAIELGGRRVVGGRDCHHQRAYRRRLARLRGAYDRDMACRSGQVDCQRITALIVWAVDQADRYRQRTIRSSAGNQNVECRRLPQWRQPDRMRTHPWPPVDQRRPSGPRPRAGSASCSARSVTLPTGAAVNTRGVPGASGRCAMPGLTCGADT